MIEIEVTIRGTTPLLCNRFTDEAAAKASGGKSMALVGDKGSPRDIAGAKLYLDAKGKPCLPQPNVMACIIEAGKFFKAGKSKITTQKSSLIPACLALRGITFPLVHKDPWEVDTRPVRIPATGGRILCHRASFNDWELSFEAELDTEFMDAKLLREIVDAAGKRVGLGDFRPACKGPFGRFVVTKWKEKKMVAEAAE